MQKRKIQRRPSYAIESVDNALRLLQLLRDENAIRVSDAAADLGVSVSTAHRLLAMLVYRGFAVQDESKRYLPGPAIGASPVSVSWTSMLRTESLPHMERLRDELGETVHLAVRVGSKMHFLHTLESQASVRVGDLRGAVLEAHESGGGIMLLSELHDQQLARMYGAAGGGGRPSLSRMRFVELMKNVTEARRLGYAINRELAEPGVGAIGFPLRLPSGRAIAALMVASPIFRLESLLEPESIQACLDAAARIDAMILVQGIDVS